MQYRDYYKELGVESGANEDEIKKAYRRLARKYHPDVSKEPEAEARFKAINEAYEVLRDKDRRAAYDNLGSNYQEGQSFRPPPGWQSRGSGFQDDTLHGEGFSDFFESLFRRHGAGAGPHAGTRRAPPRPVRATLTLTLEQSYHGGVQRITLNDRSYDVRIPAGIGHGQSIRLTKQGPNEADVLLEVALAPHPVFEVAGRDITGRVVLPPWQAALGGPVQVQTLGGTVQLNVPAGSQPGRRLRLKGRGLPGQSPGDHYALIDIKVPPADSDEHRAAWLQLAQAYGETVPAS